jgi:hypothetical protein
LLVKVKVAGWVCAWAKPMRTEEIAATPEIAVALEKSLNLWV